MNRQTALKLREKAKDVARLFSDPSRIHNPNDETFELEKINVLSEHTAAVTYLKSSGKRAVAFFYFNNENWYFFFPSDSNLLGMEAFIAVKREVEKMNFDKNFLEEDIS